MQQKKSTWKIFYVSSPRRDERLQCLGLLIAGHVNCKASRIAAYISTEAHSLHYEQEEEDVGSHLDETKTNI